MLDIKKLSPFFENTCLIKSNFYSIVYHVLYVLKQFKYTVCKLSYTISQIKQYNERGANCIHNTKGDMSDWVMFKNRLLSKLATEWECVGNTKHRIRAYFSVREDSSTRSTCQLPSTVEFRKKSTVKWYYVMHSGLELEWINYLSLQADTFRRIVCCCRYSMEMLIRLIETKVFSVSILYINLSKKIKIIS